MKHTRHSKGCPNSNINTQCRPLWRQCRWVLSHANCHKGAECHPVIDCPKNLAPVVAIQKLLWQVMEKGTVSSGFIMSHMYLIGERSGVPAGQGVVVHHEEHIVLQQLYVDVHCPSSKSTSPSCRGNDSSTVLTTCAM